VGCGLWVVVWAERNFTVAFFYLRFLLVLHNEKKFDFNNISSCCGLITPSRVALNVSHCPEVSVKMQISSRSLSCALLLPLQVAPSSSHSKFPESNEPFCFGSLCRWFRSAKKFNLCLGKRAVCLHSNSTGTLL